MERRTVDAADIADKALGLILSLNSLPSSGDAGGDRLSWKWTREDVSDLRIQFGGSRGDELFPTSLRTDTKAHLHALAYVIEELWAEHPCLSSETRMPVDRDRIWRQSSRLASLAKDIQQSEAGATIVARVTPLDINASDTPSMPPHETKEPEAQPAIDTSAERTDDELPTPIQIETVCEHINPPRQSWQDIRNRMIEMTKRGEPFTKQTDIADKLGCNQSMVSKAITRTPALKTWSEAGSSGGRSVYAISDREEVLNTAPTKVNSQADEPTEDEVATIIARLIDQADRSGNMAAKAKLNGMTDDERKQIATTAYRDDAIHAAIFENSPSA